MSDYAMSETRLFLLGYKKPYCCDYDQAEGFVVRATTEEHARRIARRNDDGVEDWTHPLKTFCREFISPGRVGVVLKAVRYG